MARWTAFKPRGHFSFDARSVQTRWPQLHAADCEPLPDDRYLLEGWALFHNGRFEEAHRAGLALGVEGLTLVNKASCIHAAHLESRAATRMALLQATAERAAAHVLAQAHNPNAHYLLACALAHYSRGLSVAQVLAQRHGSSIKAALETSIALQARHADAHFALGAFHADIIDKVGILIGAMTYAVRVQSCLKLFQSGFALCPHSVFGMLEYALALHRLEGDAQEQEVQGLYQKAAALEAHDAHDYLLIAQARCGYRG